MDDLPEVHVPSKKVGSVIPRAQERELGYRALAAHLRRGTSLADAVKAIHVELSVTDEDSRDAEHTERERVIAAIDVVAKAHATLVKSPEKPFSRALSEAGVKLSLPERAILSVPGSAVLDDDGIAGLFEAVVAAMERGKA